MKSFTKVERSYYTRPNRFLEEMTCLDCKLAVSAMLGSATAKKTVVFYCDDGIKGYDVPLDDPIKAKLVCDLVLCPPCAAVWQIRFESMNDSRGGSRRKRSRQEAGR